jgi:hypothetical protein
MAFCDEMNFMTMVYTNWLAGDKIMTYGIYGTYGRAYQMNMKIRD